MVRCDRSYWCSQQAGTPATSCFTPYNHRKKVSATGSLTNAPYSKYSLAVVVFGVAGSISYFIPEIHPQRLWSTGPLAKPWHRRVGELLFHVHHTEEGSSSGMQWLVGCAFFVLLLVTVVQQKPKQMLRGNLQPNKRHRDDTAGQTGAALSATPAMLPQEDSDCVVQDYSCKWCNRNDFETLHLLMQHQDLCKAMSGSRAPDRQRDAGTQQTGRLHQMTAQEHADSSDSLKSTQPSLSTKRSRHTQEQASAAQHQQQQGEQLFDVDILRLEVEALYGHLDTSPPASIGTEQQEQEEHPSQHLFQQLVLESNFTPLCPHHPCNCRLCQKGPVVAVANDFPSTLEWKSNLTEDNDVTVRLEFVLVHETGRDHWRSAVLQQLGVLRGATFRTIVQARQLQSTWSAVSSVKRELDDTQPSESVFRTYLRAEVTCTAAQKIVSFRVYSPEIYVCGSRNLCRLCC